MQKPHPALHRTYTHTCVCVCALVVQRPVDPALVKVITMPGLPVEVFMRPVSSPAPSSPRGRLRFAVETVESPTSASIPAIARHQLHAKHALSISRPKNEQDRQMLNVTSIGEGKTDQLQVRLWAL